MEQTCVGGVRFQRHFELPVPSVAEGSGPRGVISSVVVGSGVGVISSGALRSSAESRNLTPSMARAVEETNRRRRLQAEYNERQWITPETVRKEIHNILGSVYESDYMTVPIVKEKGVEYRTVEELDKYISELEKQMKEAAVNLEFEEAARLRDEMRELKEQRLEVY